MKCDKCGKKIRRPLFPGALPSAIGFQMKDGSVITVCKKCIMDLGSRDEAGKDEFFKELGVETE